MADLKISQLTGATTPLAGTEVLPIVQSGTTKQVSVANLTAGRSQTSNGIVQGTAGTGYNFTANTPAAGMTSQLLNWYEEGTWTPTIASSSGTITSYTTANCTYTRVGRQVTLLGTFTITNNGTGSGNIQISALPFAVANTNSAGGMARETANTGNMCSISIDGSTTTLIMRFYENSYPGGTGNSFKFMATYIA